MSLCPVLDYYLELVDSTESPTIFHRWSFITAVAASLARRTRYPMATGDIYPNMFTLLLGPPGAKKSTSIRMATDLVKQAGYSHISSGKTSPEQFLVDLQLGFDAVNLSAGDFDSFRLPDPSNPSQSSHVLVQAGELQAYLGQSNLAFITLLTDLWDNLDSYPYRLKNGTLELINRPTVSLLGGATASTFKRIFPTDVLGQGTLSRFILVHSGGRRQRVFEPKPLDPEMTATLLEQLSALHEPANLVSVFSHTPSAYEFSKAIYEQGEAEITDARFQYYANRRNDHYLKLAMVIAALNFHDKLTLEDCMLANTILTYTEKFMPMALGEFGLDKGADKTEYLYQLISKFPQGLDLKDLVDKGMSIFGGGASELAAHLFKLEASDRVSKLNVSGKVSYVPVARVVTTRSEFVDFNLLTEYVENPTFNTQLVDQSRILELEIQADILKEVAAVKSMQSTDRTLQVSPDILNMLAPAKR